MVKVGRATGSTTGIIRDVHLSFWMHYEGVGEVGFRNQVLCTRYAASGDSGALVVEKGTMKAVGLHFAGAERGSVFNPIDKSTERATRRAGGYPPAETRRQKEITDVPFQARIPLLFTERYFWIAAAGQATVQKSGPRRVGQSSAAPGKGCRHTATTAETATNFITWRYRADMFGEIFLVDA
jgi:hypothetical protein